MDIPQQWQSLVDVWRSGQVALPAVKRWGAFDTASHGGIRQQDLLQHCYSFAVAGRLILHALRSYVTLDESLLLTSFLLHCQGVGELGQDTPYPGKSEWSDLREHAAFTDRFSKLPKNLFDDLHRAYLLQFAGQNFERFPDETKKVMEDLRQHRPMEILAFEAAERWDFVLYAAEQFRDRGNDVILSTVLQTHGPRLDELVEKLPGFGQEIWTPEIRKWRDEFLKKH